MLDTMLRMYSDKGFRKTGLLRRHCKRFMNTILKLVTFLVIVTTAHTTHAYTGKVADENGEPITGAGVYGLTVDSVFVSSAVTDSIGIYNLTNDPKIAILCIRSLGCEDQFLNPAPNDAGTINMTPRSHELKEVVVNQEPIQRLVDRTVYRLSKEQLNKYTTVLGAFNEIPYMFTNHNGDIYYKGNNNVMVQINGQTASADDIMQLSKADIARIEIYDVPPARYMMAGVTCLIDVITKEITGGNAGVSIKDALWRVQSRNSVWITYNYKRSRFDVKYNNNITRYRKSITDESLHYSLNGNEYGKTKVGKESPEDIDNHAVSVGFMNRKVRDYQFNATAGYSNEQTDKTKLQDVIYSNGTVTDASNRLKTGFDNYSLNLYFNKTQGNGNEFMANVVGTGYSTDYSSRNIESLADGSTWFESATEYSGHQHSIVGQLYYMLNSRAGSFYIGGSGSYINTRRASQGHTDRGHRSNGTAYIQYNGHRGKWYYYAMLSAKYASSDNDIRQISHRYSRWAFTPYAGLTYIPQNSLVLQIQYDRNMTNPTAAQLSETTQWIDANYMFHGNASLKPYITDAVYLKYNQQLPLINLSVSIGYRHISGYITNHFEYVGNNVLETIENLRRLDEISGLADLTVYLLRNRSLYFSTRVIGGRTWGKGTNYNWKGYRFQLMPRLTYNLKRWLFEVGYQYPGKVMEGHLVRPRAECVTLYAEYRPVDNMSVGLEWFQPFNSSFKESEHTTKESIVQTYIGTNSRDWGNIVRLSFRYNIDFGRKQDNSRQRLNYTDTDSGILTK